MLSGRSVSWTSSDPATATASVSGTGLVTGVSTGNAEITATAEGMSGSAAILVTAPPTTGSITIVPVADTLYGIGATLTLSAEARDGSGTLITNADIEWVSLDPAIAEVDSMGRLTTRALGTAIITASALCCAPDSGIFVVDATQPEQVTDLAVVGTTESTVTLEWTSVDDGAGEAASYAVRYGSPTLSWGSAYPTEELVESHTIGETVSHTFTGLSAGTDYEFQVVSYRGTLNVDAEFGPRSNVVAATPESVSGGALRAGTASASGGDGQVSLSATAPSGGTSPYTYLWHGGTSDPGSSPGAATALDGLTSRSATQTGLSNGTTYYYRLVITDATGATVVTNVASATPQERSSEPLYPNLPANMTVIGRADGSIAEAGGSAFGIPDFGGWYGHTGGGSQNVSVVNDAGNPTGSGKAVRLTWITADSEAAIADMRFSGGPWTELYIMHRVVMPSCWMGRGSGHKWFYLLPDGEDRPGSSVWTSQETDDRLRVIDGNDVAVVSTDRGVLGARNTELAMEYHFIAESSPGADDGRVNVWVNGDLVATGTGVAMAGSGYEPSWGRIHYYAHANEVPPGDCHFDVRELFVAGK